MKPQFFTILFSFIFFHGLSAQREINENWLLSANRPRAVEQIGGFIDPTVTLQQHLKANGNNVQWNINSNGLGIKSLDRYNYGPYDLKNSPYASKFPATSIAVGMFVNDPDLASIRVFNYQEQAMPIVGYIDLNENIAFPQTNAYWPKVPMKLGEQADLDVTAARDPNIDYELFEYKESMQYDAFGNLTFDNVNYDNCFRTVLTITNHIKGVHKITKKKIEEKYTIHQYRWYTDHFYPVVAYSENETIFRSPDGGFPLYDTSYSYSLDHFKELSPLSANKPLLHQYSLANTIGEGPLALKVNATQWDRAQWEIIDLSGKVTDQGAMLLVPGEQQWNIPTDRLVPGHYHLVIRESTAHPVAMKFVRQ